MPRPLALLDQLRGLEAVHARHLDVEQDRRELLVEQAPQRLLARRGADEVGLERLEDRLQGEQVLRPVVDEQQLRPVGHRAAQPVEERCDLVERQHGVRDRARDRRVRHRPPLRRVRVLDDRDAAVALDRGEAGGAVLVRAREHDPDRAVAVDLGDRLEEDVDRRPRELDARVDGEREVAVLDEQVVVGRSDVDVTAARAAPCRPARRRAAPMWRCSSDSSTPRFDSGERCWATTIAWSSCCGIPSSNVPTACSPPQDAPIAITS